MRRPPVGPGNGNLHDAGPSEVRREARLAESEPLLDGRLASPVFWDSAYVVAGANGRLVFVGSGSD